MARRDAVGVQLHIAENLVRLGPSVFLQGVAEGGDVRLEAADVRLVPAKFACGLDEELCGADGVGGEDGGGDLFSLFIFLLLLFFF